MTRFRPGPVWSAYEAQRDLLRSWLGELPDAAWSVPSVLDGWTVLELATHVAFGARTSVDVLNAGGSLERPVSLGDYTAHWQPGAGTIAGIAAAAAATLSAPEVLTIWDDGNAALTELVERAPGLADDLVVLAPRRPLRIGDFLATRVNELVVHSGDLSRSVPSVQPVAVDQRALAVSCRMLATILSDRNPGHSVEVRVPPYAAVQVIEGPRHTRGTPANVVETDPATWVLIAAGRLPYADAVAEGLVAASGQRADLGPYLPLF
jgi:uncharacterized protein (TIGR03083 family)